jgi:hypothetical protein
VKGNGSHLETSERVQEARQSIQRQMSRLAMDAQEWRAAATYSEVSAALSTHPEIQAALAQIADYYRNLATRTEQAYQQYVERCALNASETRHLANEKSVRIQSATKLRHRVRHHVRGAIENGGDLTTFPLELERKELLALLSYMALGSNFCAIATGEGGFLSPDEVSMHMMNVNTNAAKRFAAKLQLLFDAGGQKDE